MADAFLLEDAPANAYDNFGRTLSSDWGNADLGGAYTKGGSFALHNVAGGVGTHNLSAANTTLTGSLLSVAAQDTDQTIQFKTDKVAAGDKIYAQLLAREVTTSLYYRMVVAMATDQTLDLSAYAYNAGDTAVGDIVQVPRETHAAGTWFNFRVKTTGVSPTTIEMKLWQVGTSEPSAWDFSATDSTAALQVTAGIGVKSYLGASASNAPVLVSYDNYLSTAIASGTTDNYLLEDGSGVLLLEGVAGTDANAGAASGTGAAGGSDKTVAPTGGHAAGTGAASNAAVTTAKSVDAGHAAGTGAAHAATTLLASNASPGLASGTGSAGAVSASVAPNAGHAAGTGTAHNATVAIAQSVAAGHASGTGAAHDATLLLASNASAGHAAGVGNAGAPSVSVAPSAGHASGTGAAADATVSTSTASTDVDAGHAAGTGAAENVTSAISVNAGHASGTGIAHGANGSEDASALLASGSGTAFDAIVQTAVNAVAGAATGTGAAGNVSAIVAPVAGAATGTGAANDATVAVSGQTVVQAGHASGTGAAYNATVDTGAVVVPRPVLGKPIVRHPHIRVDAGVAMGTGEASGASLTIMAGAITARGTGTAHDATTTWNDDESALFVLLGDLELVA